MAVRAILAASLFTLTAGSDRQIDTLYMFSGTGGARAYSIDQTGANLPRQYAPWKFIHTVATSGPTFKSGADKAALRAVEKHGYSVRVFEITLEPSITTPEHQ